MTLTQLFDLSLIDRQKEPALEFEESTYTFGDLDKRSNQIAQLLLQKRFTAGDRLCLYLENSVDFISIYLACVKVGIIVVPINILYKDREINHIISDAEPKALIASEPTGDALYWNVKHMIAESASKPEERPKTSLTGDSPAAIVYTSGTTGTSKGAVLSHNNFIANTINLITCWKMSSTDRLLLGLPLFHVHGLANGMHCWLVAGFRLKLLVKYQHETAPAVFESFKPTLFFGVPTIYVRLLDQPEAIAKQIGSTVRLFVSGSAPLPPQVMEDFKIKYGSTILERYGMTETLINISNPYVGERRAGTVGFPLPGMSVEIVNPDGHEAAIDEEGELYVKGPNVFSGYWKRPDATAEAFEDGYFKTGDMCVVSADGYYTLRGRKSDLIISSGYNIYPREIEEFLLEQEEIAEAAVVGMPDQVKGEIPVAYLVTKSEVNIEQLEKLCKKSLAAFKVPKKFVIVDHLPRTALGKVQKHLLPK